MKSFFVSSIWFSFQLNTSTSGLNQAVRVKTTRLHVALCGNFSGLVSAHRSGWKLKRISKSCSLHSKKFIGWGVRIFCEWYHKWRTFRPPCALHLALGPNC